MTNRKRNIQVKFYVTAEEKELMEQKMVQLQAKWIGNYLWKMAIDGYIIYARIWNIKEMNRPFPPLSGTSTRSPNRSATEVILIRSICRKSGKG